MVTQTTAHESAILLLSGELNDGWTLVRIDSHHSAKVKSSLAGDSKT